MVSQDYPTIPSPNPHQGGNDLKDEDFPRPEDDKDVQYSHVDRLMGYAPKKKRTWLRVILIILAVAVLGVGGWFAAKHVHFSNKQTSAKTTRQPVSSQPSVEAPKLKTFSSTNFALSFSYPETWGVIDDGSGKLTATSPIMDIKNSGGKTVKARIAATIRNRQNALPEFVKGNAVAAITSEKLSYAKPTGNQRAQTYISFLNYASSPTDGIDGVYVTGDNGYQKGQAIPQADIVQTDPLITVSFSQCADSSCSSGGTALTAATDEWKNRSLSEPIKIFITSLAIR